MLFVRCTVILTLLCCVFYLFQHSLQSKVRRGSAHTPSAAVTSTYRTSVSTKEALRDVNSFIAAIWHPQQCKPPVMQQQRIEQRGRETTERKEFHDECTETTKPISAPPSPPRAWRRPLLTHNRLFFAVGACTYRVVCVSNETTLLLLFGVVGGCHGANNDRFQGTAPSQQQHRRQQQE